VHETLGHLEQARDLYERALSMLDADPSISFPQRYALEGWLREALARIQQQGTASP